MKHQNLVIEYVPIESIRPNDKNPRLHNRKQRRKLTSAMRRFGFTNPVLINEAGDLIAGHCRLAAAADAGLKVIPVIRLRDLTEAEQLALMVADNQLGAELEWDPDKLKTILQHLVDIKFDVEELGFDGADIDFMLGNDDHPIVDEADEVAEPDRTKPPISRLGDLFVLGAHRLLCGDALNACDYERLLQGRRAAMVFTDPPYNRRIDELVGRGAHKHPEFAMASGEMSVAEFTTFLRACTSMLVRFSTDGSLHFICMDWRHIAELLAAASDLYEFKNLCVWAKDNGGLGSLYRSAHELVALFKSGTAPHTNNIQLGRKGRFRTNVWRYPGVNSMRKGRLEDLAAHPTVKPVSLVAHAILDCSNVGDLVLDPFVGSGTTLLACERTQRRAVTVEIDPHYVDVAIERFQQRTGIQAIHVESGLTFAALAAQRTGEA